MSTLTRREFIMTNGAALTGLSLVPGLAYNPFGSGPEGQDLFAKLPAIPYGAVYFRKSNPPRAEWEQDYREAARIGINAFRHWFMWSAIEVAPGKYDWDDYDRQLDLAARYGIKTIIAEILATAPDWAFREFRHARVEDASGHKSSSSYTIASAVSGYPGLCLDNEDVRERAGAFLEALATRYKDHPGMGGYDVWNEQNMNGGAGSCWCNASADKFRAWVKEKYKSLDALAEAWNRYSYRDWDDIEIPRHTDFYGDAIDWVLFRIDNSYRLMKWRVDTIKGIDPDHPVTAHSIPDGMLDRLGPGTYHVWKAGALVDGFGFSGGGNGNESSLNRWKHWLTADLTRAGAKGKPFWCAEMASGNAWRAKGVTPEKGRMYTARDVRLSSMTSYACGATGVFSPRWRPLQNGPFTGCFAFCEMDGSLTDRARMAGEMAVWSNEPEQKDLWQARPVRGEVGIIVVPESQIQVWLLEDRPEYYYHAISGAYQGFQFNNIQADFVNADDIESTDHKVLYLPHPLMLSKNVAEALKAYVGKGGTLISEGCPAYYGDHGKAGTSQPNYGLDKLFRATEERVEFTPVLLEKMRFRTGGETVAGGLYLQSYKPSGGKVSGTFSDGSPAVIDNSYGLGKTRLIGTSPGYGYYNYGKAAEDISTRAFFSGLLSWAGIPQHVKSGDPRIAARIHEGDGYHVLWIINSDLEDITTELELSDRWGNYKKAGIVENHGSITHDGKKLKVSLPAKDVAIIKFS